MTDELRLERTFRATPAVVFDAFFSLAGQEAFYGRDEAGWIVEAGGDLREGGTWTVAFGPSRDQLYEHRSVLEVVERPRRIVLATTERRLDGSSFAFSVEVTFEELDGGTRMTLIQSGFPTDVLREEHGRGVPHAFDRLERAIGSRP